jgi:hypothetical protein
VLSCGEYLLVRNRYGGTEWIAVARERPFIEK